MSMHSVNPTPIDSILPTVSNVNGGVKVRETLDNKVSDFSYQFATADKYIGLPLSDLNMASIVTIALHLLPPTA